MSSLLIILIEGAHSNTFLIDTGNTQPAGNSKSSTVTKFNLCNCVCCCASNQPPDSQFIISMINSLSMHSTQLEEKNKHGRKMCME